MTSRRHYTPDVVPSSSSGAMTSRRHYVPDEEGFRDSTIFGSRIGGHLRQQEIEEEEDQDSGDQGAAASSAPVENEEQDAATKKNNQELEEIRRLFEGRKPILRANEVYSMLESFKKAFATLLASPVFSVIPVSSSSGRGGLPASEVSKLAATIKELDLRTKAIARETSQARSVRINIASSGLIQNFRSFVAAVRAFQDMPDESMLVTIKARGLEVRESIKEIALAARTYEEDKRSKAKKDEKETSALQEVRSASDIKMRDIYRSACEVARSIGRMEMEHGTADPKFIFKAALARQTSILRFVALGRSFASRFPSFKEKNTLLVDISSTILMAAGRLHSTELSLISNPSAVEQASALQSALMGVTQMITQFLMTCVDLVQSIKQNTAARRQKETPVWEEPPLKNPANITEATFNQIVRALVENPNKRAPPVRTFFRTYRSLCTPQYLLQKVIQIYDVPESHAPKAEVIKTGVLAFIKQWLEEAPRDFTSPMIAQLIEFDKEDTASHVGEESIIKPLLQRVTLSSQAIEGVGATLLLKSSLETSEAQRYLDSLTAEEFAQQLFLLDSNLWNSIQPAECLEASWSKENTRHLSPNILAMFAQHDFVHQLVVTSILEPPTLRGRTAALTRFIQIGIRLFQIRGYASVCAIDSAISEQAVKRMKHTFSDVDASLLAEWRTVSTQVSDTNHYANIRPLLVPSAVPLVPPLGLYIADLLQIEDRHKLYTDRGLINYAKCDLLSAVIGQIQDLQGGEITFERDHHFAPALKSLKLLDRDQYYSVSSDREPRNARKEDLK